MARGWESKSVEDQINQKENPSKTSRQIPRNQAVLREKRDGLMLARARTLNDLQSAHDTRYRALLERTLSHLDGQIAALESPR